MNLRYENKKIRDGYLSIIGCDEVGRGCLAGPVVAAAVILNLKTRPTWFSEIKDSKQLSAEKREYLSELIKSNALWSIGEVSSEVVDEINIHNASLLAMRKAIQSVIPDVIGNLNLGQDSRLRENETLFLAVDGKFPVPGLSIHQQPIIEGDNKVLSIAAASIVAKVYRDNLMQNFDKQYSGYEFARHKGYATEYHRKMVIQHGLTPIHRLSFCQKLIV